ncbi:MAG TPA: hypothetical protein PK264_16065, partial [Hyphomicrobiaceae bacterium]|nr:hypothetical protein [Hyphomicrobiaceae bacterium]
MYRTLDAAKLIVSLDTLGRRIGERFPDASLRQVGTDLADIAREHSERARQISGANWPLRAFVAIVLAGGLWLIVRIVGLMDLSKTAADNVYTVLQGVEATLNIVVLMGGALFFLITVEDRLKRRRALMAIHELRSIVHVIDMHQLTKDPSGLLQNPGQGDTPSSPRRTYTPFELTRYLDYCSEMLSLAAKVAALYAQSYPDPVVTSSVNELEQLTANLSQKIWQKISIVEQMIANMPRASVPSVKPAATLKPDGTKAAPV